MGRIVLSAMKSGPQTQKRRTWERLDLRIQNILIPDRKIDAVAKDIKNANAINYVR